MRMELLFSQSDINYEYQNDYAGSDQGLLSSMSPSQKYYRGFVVCSFSGEKETTKIRIYNSKMIDLSILAGSISDV